MGKRLPPDLSKKAEGLLHFYGGLEGLSRNPAWVVGIVLKSWFTESEARQIVRYIVQGVKPEARNLYLREVGFAA